jgi:NAD(P)-dependent dehydrogenase (short-subunit alcohol dehydrogenase family)
VTDELERFRLDDRVALVAGGSGGIGVRLCGALAGVGAKVAIVGRSEAGLEAAREAVEAAGAQALVLPADMTKEADADRVVEETLASWGRLDVLINAIGGGIGKVMNPAEAFVEADWDWQLDINLKTQFLLSKAAARAMIAGGRGGRIVNISSVRGQLGIHLGYSPYVAAKAAMNGLTRQHATEWAKYGITVNAISPTFVATEQATVFLQDKDFYESLVNRIPLGRIASTDDMVGPVLFFCSDASAFVTGQILTCDGGLTATQ